LVEGSTPEQQEAADEAATLLLSLPWELIRDGQGYLFQGARGVQVRRRLPNSIVKDPLKTDPPIRVLLVSPRPEDERAPYIDHRISARPLAEALAPLGELAELTLLNPPTFRALQDELQRDSDANRPYHVVHFDGHGVYDRRHGLGALCFEDEHDATNLDRRRSRTIDAVELAQVIRSHRVPLFVLEACQSAMADKDPTASVAGRLLQGGAATVWMLRRQYDGALDAYAAVSETFDRIGEFRSVAVACHQSGMVHRRAGQYEAAERALQASLKIEVQTEAIVRAKLRHWVSSAPSITRWIGRRRPCVSIGRQ
jgi:hypothetical protein